MLVLPLPLLLPLLVDKSYVMLRIGSTKSTHVVRQPCNVERLQEQRSSLLVTQVWYAPSSKLFVRRECRCFALSSSLDILCMILCQVRSRKKREGIASVRTIQINIMVNKKMQRDKMPIYFTQNRRHTRLHRRHFSRHHRYFHS